MWTLTSIADGYVRAILLFAAGVAIGVYLPTEFSVGAWFTALVLLLFAFIGKRVAQRFNH